MSRAFLAGFVFCTSLCLTSVPARAQTTWFPNLNIGPTKGEVVAIGIAGVVVVGLVVYLVIPKQTTIEGCVDRGDGGLRLTNKKDKHIYNLISGKVTLQTGQRVFLRGKKGKKGSGIRNFQVRRLVKDEGSCKE